MDSRRVSAARGFGGAVHLAARRHQCTGSAFNEKMFLRSWTNEFYLWYNEVPDTNPNNFADGRSIFSTLSTRARRPRPATTRTGSISRSIPPLGSRCRKAGQSIGYGAELMIIGDGTPPRRAVVAYVEPGTPAGNANVLRGMEVLTVNGVDFVNDNTQSGVNTLNAAFFPSATGQAFTFGFRPPGGGATVTVPLTTANITHKPVLLDTTIPQGADTVGYLVFNDHIATAEDELFDAITRLQNAGIDDLILDIRYNGGGFLDIASELTLHDRGPRTDDGQIFERLVFNNKHPNRNPISGEPLAPTPFHTDHPGFRQSHARHAAADAEPEPRLRDHRPEHVLGERVDHQRPARRRRRGVPDRLDHLRQAFRLLSAGQLRHDVLLDPVPGRERDELRRLPGRLRAATTRPASAA